MKKVITILFIIFGLIQLNAQVDLKKQLSGYVNPDELVTLSENITFDNAIQVLSTVSEKQTGKKIVSTVSVNNPIGVELNNIQYKKALFIIAQYNNFMVDETENTIVVRRKDDSKIELAKDIYAPVDEREVRITALLFEANVAEMQEKGLIGNFFFQGVDWQLAASW